MMFRGNFVTYQVFDCQTQTVVATYTDSKRARRAAARRNQEYGAVRFCVRYA